MVKKEDDKYSDSLFTFLGYLYAFVRIIDVFPALDHSTIHRGVTACVLEVEVKGDVLIVDSIEFRMEKTTQCVEYQPQVVEKK